MEQILVIDDDVELCALLAEYLEPEGFKVSVAHDGQEGLDAMVTRDFSLVVLDVMLPGMNGFEILQRIRARSRIPVLMLTARGEDVDRIVGLEMGADDYLPKPFNPRELLARIRAILRRAGQQEAEGPEMHAAASGRIHLGDIQMNLGAHDVLVRGEPVDLTAVEFKLLEVLVRRVGNVVPREELAQLVLGRAYSAFDRSIDVHVSSLRKKLGHALGGTERIKSIRGIGYLYTRPVGPGGGDVV